MNFELTSPVVAGRSPRVLSRWQREMRRAVRSASELCRRLDLPAELVHAAAERDFPVFAPLGFIARMQTGDPDDPLLRQVLPRADESLDQPDFVRDPLSEFDTQMRPGLLQKYVRRALIVTTGVCAVHCRYCFRRHFPYHQAPRSPAAWQPALAAVADDPTIDEVILSGGDPLTLTDALLARLARQIDAIGHVRRLRIHTRLPIVIPQRVNKQLLAWLKPLRAAPIVVVHANHPAEIDAAVARALARLVNAGIPVLNQAVLLRGVNDRADVLAELCRRLVDLRVMPYYLHQLDRVAGAAHFEVPIEEGVRLVEALRAQLPGYAVPRYVQEVPGEDSKVVLR